MLTVACQTRPHPPTAAGAVQDLRQLEIVSRRAPASRLSLPPGRRTGTRTKTSISAIRSVCNCHRWVSRAPAAASLLDGCSGRISGSPEILAGKKGIAMRRPTRLQLAATSLRAGCARTRMSRRKNKPSFSLIGTLGCSQSAVNHASPRSRLEQFRGFFGPLIGCERPMSAAFSGSREWRPSGIVGFGVKPDGKGGQCAIGAPGTGPARAPVSAAVRGQALHELQRRDHDMGGSVAVGTLELQHDMSCWIAFEPFVGNGRAGDIAAARGGAAPTVS